MNRAAPPRLWPAAHEEPCDRREHWEAIFRSRSPSEVSGYQPEAELSLGLIRRTTPDLDAPIIDVGGGASTLVDGLPDTGYEAVTVLDLAPAALRLARARLGALSAQAATSSLPASRPEAPTRCSGLEVVRYVPDTMHAEFGEGFRLLDSVREDHRTPAGSTQAFVHCLCRVERSL